MSEQGKLRVFIAKSSADKGLSHTRLLIRTRFLHGKFAQVLKGLLYAKASLNTSKYNGLYLWQRISIEIFMTCRYSDPIRSDKILSNNYYHR